MTNYVLNVMSDDHPGIISSVAAAIESLNGNILSCSQTVLGGYFTLIMIVTLPETMKPEELQAYVLNYTAGSCKIDVSVRVANGNAPKKDTPERYVVSVFGTDQVGVVRRFTEYMADHEINIVDMYGGIRKNTNGEDEFFLTGQIEIPTKWNFPMLQCDLEALGKELGFTVRLQHENIFVATNRIRFRH